MKVSKLRKRAMERIDRPAVLPGYSSQMNQRGRRRFLTVRKLDESINQSGWTQFRYFRARKRQGIGCRK
jgi:hypothetical protein